MLVISENLGVVYSLPMCTDLLKLVGDQLVKLCKEVCVNVVCKTWCVKLLKRMTMPTNPESGPEVRVIIFESRVT